MAKRNNIKRDHIDRNDTDGWKEYYKEEKPKKGENSEDKKKREARNKRAKMKAHDTWMRKGSSKPKDEKPKDDTKKDDTKKEEKPKDDKPKDDTKKDNTKNNNMKKDTKKNDSKIVGAILAAIGKKKAKKYPFMPLAFVFKAGLEDGKPEDLQFQEVSGLSMSLETEPLNEGGNEIVYQLPTRIKYENVVLKRGMIPAKSKIAKWCRETLDKGISQKIELKNLKIELLSPTKMKPLMKWSIEGAYPVKWEISSLNAQESAIVFETMEFVVRKVKVEAV